MQPLSPVPFTYRHSLIIKCFVLLSQMSPVEGCNLEDKRRRQGFYELFSNVVIQS